MKLINKTSKQSIIRDIEIKNKRTVTRGAVGGFNGEERGRIVRNMYKGHMDKAKEGWIRGGRRGWLRGG